jgi:hypothetical protein
MPLPHEKRNKEKLFFFQRQEPLVQPTRPKKKNFHARTRLARGASSILCGSAINAYVDRE